jgi:hypothetical protein
MVGRIKFQSDEKGNHLHIAILAVISTIMQEQVHIQGTRKKPTGRGCNEGVFILC